MPASFAFGSFPGPMSGMISPPTESALRETWIRKAILFLSIGCAFDVFSKPSHRNAQNDWETGELPWFLRPRSSVAYQPPARTVALRDGATKRAVGAS